MRFEVYKSGNLDKDFVIHGASLFGADRIPFRNSKYMALKNGGIDCAPRGSEPAGLSLLWPVEGFGNVILYTTRLPERSEPYILNLELARAKLMEIYIKREEWAVVEQNAELSELFDKAKDSFVMALDNINDQSKASVFADACIQKAMVLSEKMALTYADMLFAARLKNKGFSRSSLGCKIEPAQLGSKNYLKAASELFAHISVPINWAKMEPVKGQYDFTELDRCVKVFGQKRLLISAGPLLRFEPEFLPEWMRKDGKDFERIRQDCYEFVSKVVTRYARYIHIWQVIGAMNACNYFKFSFDRILEITRTACLAAREADNRSLKMIEIIYPWGEYYAHDYDTVPPLVYVDMVTQAGINFDAIGVQMIFGKDSPGMHIRDMMQISSMLDKFFNVSKPLHITSVSVPDTSSTPAQSPDSAGMWRSPWSQNLQARWIEDFYKIAFSKPYINTVTYSSLADGADGLVVGGGLLSEKYKPKKAFVEMAKMQKQLLQKK
ncbi:MAG: endo-1,4-beta-xylanase [Anaerohalosphaeraceae bacterium]|nr:endo-1,4-beta-xylanase [Anaerohalosphaeraceae bacterium]